MNRMVLALLTLLWSAIPGLAGTAETSDTSPYWGKLRPGPHAVGFLFMEFESSKLASEESGLRRIPVVVFYPSTNDGGIATYRDLIHRTCGSRYLRPTTEPPDSCSARWARMLRDYRKDLSTSEAAHQLDFPLFSRSEATPVKGSFPVIVFDGGLTSDALTYVPLNEYLASHGLIVVSLPSLPHAVDKPLAFDVAGIESKTRDVLTVVDQLDAIANADGDRVAVAAWSVGGVSTLLAAMQEDRIRAVLSLDGGMGYAYGPTLAEQSSLYKNEPIRATCLHVTGRKPNPHNVPKTDVFFAETVSSRAFLADLENVNHSNFVVQGGAVAYAGATGVDADLFWKSNAALAELSRIFLEHFVRDGSGHFIEIANRINPDVLVVRPGLEPHPGEDTDRR